VPQPLPIAHFLNAPGILLDVRSPGEFAQGHIPGAISFPLFTNEERSQVGICYKQQGRNAAVELGFAIAGSKFAGFIAQARELSGNHPIRLHCWRGGMRSEAVAWVLELAGMNVSLLTGGYKAFRHWTLSQFAIKKQAIVLGGMTGSGKTDILTALTQQGAQVLDLEALANHRGSSYGGIGLPPQPTTEQFENLIAIQWEKFQPDQPIWIEAESKRIGTCRIPEALFQQMEQTPVVEICRPRAERLDAIVQTYGTLDRAALIAATQRIHKRLGGLRSQQAVAFLQAGQIHEAFDIVLDYYDKTYTYDLQRRSVTIYPVEVTGLSAEDAAIVIRAEGSKLPASHPSDLLQDCVKS
jgi:tRNA 2-selenouridine synthase